MARLGRIFVGAIEIPFIESFLWQLLAVPLLIGLARFLSRVDRRPFAEYGPGGEPSHVALGALMGAGLVGAIWAGFTAFGWVEIGPRIHNRYDVPFLVGWFGFALRYASVALFEELFHRGVLITNLAEGLGGVKPRRTRRVSSPP